VHDLRGTISAVESKMHDISIRTFLDIEEFDAFDVDPALILIYVNPTLSSHTLIIGKFLFKS
jgi:hypothetical protein